MATKPQTYTHVAQVTARGMARGGTWRFRETAKFWVSERGFKFRKADGTEAGAEWPTFTMQVETLRAAS